MYDIVYHTSLQQVFETLYILQEVKVLILKP